MYIYAQLDINNICVGISRLSGEVPELNYNTPTTYDPISEEWVTGEPVFLSRMIQIPEYSDAFVGLRYTDECKWEQVV